VKLSQRRLARPSLGGMLATRQGSLTLALICAACAAGILVFALGRYKTSLKTPVTQASVLVATSGIPKGTSGQTVASERLYKLAPVAVSQVTPGAISDAGAIANETTAIDILPGQQLTTADFTGVTEVAATLTPDQRAVAISFNETPGDTDVLQAGDRVDIYWKSSASATAPVAPLMTNVLVLKAASPVVAKHDGVPISGGSMVVAINSNEVAPLIAAELGSTLWVSLRPASNSTVTPGSSNAATLAEQSAVALNTPPAVNNPTNLPTTGTKP
jgi:Flp pilus assembly protein CpaB